MKQEEIIVNRLKREIKELISFAKKYENSLLAICFSYIKNRRKRPFHLGIIGKSVLLLTLLYGGHRKATAQRIDVSTETTRQWLTVSGIGTLEELKFLFDNKLEKYLEKYGRKDEVKKDKS